MVKKIISIVISIMLIFSLAACSSKSEKDKTRYETAFLELYDTATRIVVYADSEEEFEGYSQIIYDNLHYKISYFNCVE